MRLHVILAVLKRNVASYFTGVLGYLFITAFVALAVALAFDGRFFTNNDCSLDRLSENYHWLLLFIVPAITMAAWAEERRQGTDELLFTLPARDFEILIGKYGAVLMVYTVALFFTFPLLIALEVLGQPDYGAIIATYTGYWLSGAAMLAVGMFASSLTNSSTVAFVLAAIMCALFVFIDQLVALRSWLEAAGIREPLGVSGYLHQFSTGVIPLGGAVYFGAITALFLYLNAVMIARRHWQGSPEGTSLGLQYLVRALSIAVVVVSLSYATSVIGSRLDLTKGGLFSLSPTSRKVIQGIDAKRPVTLTAYLSEDVPKEYLPIQKKLKSLLREFDKIGGSRVDVRIVSVDPLSKEAEEASQWGIQARPAQSERDGRFSVEEVFLGVVASSGFDQVVIPYFEKGTPVEFELTRAIGTVAREKRLTVGILTTDAKVFGGMNMQTFQPDPEWRLVSELKRQYHVREVSPDRAILVKGAPKPSAPEADAMGDKAPKTDEEAVDVLVAILPSTLTQEQMKNLVDYVQAGGATLIFDDPAPVFVGLANSPNIPTKPSQGGGMFGMGGQPGAPKADNGQATSLMDAIGVDWDTRSVLFDNRNPHPKHEERFPKQLVFVTSTRQVITGVVTEDRREFMVRANGQSKGISLARIRNVGQIPKSGLMKNDFLVQIDGKPAEEFPSVQSFAAVLKAGKSHPIEVIRGSETVKLSVSNEVLEYAIDSLERQPGASVIRVFPDSPAAKSGIRVKDIITRFHKQTVANTRNLQAITSRLSPQSVYAVEVLRDNKPVELSLTPEEAYGINPRAAITSGLQEILGWFSGEIRKVAGSKVEFTPLLQTYYGTSGSIDWDDATQSFGFGGQRGPNFEAKRITDGVTHVIAAQIKGTAGNASNASTNAIFVADVDLVHDVMFNIFDTQIEDLVIDNTLFVMNCVDTLAGSDDYVKLRNRRPIQRTLSLIEEKRSEFDEERQLREQEATKEADRSLNEAKARIENVLAEIRENKQMDESEKIQILENATAAENRKLELDQKKIEQKKASAVREARIESHELVKGIENRIWAYSFLLCTCPALLLGLVVLVLRLLNEDSGAASDRLVSR